MNKSFGETTREDGQSSPGDGAARHPDSARPEDSDPAQHLATSRASAMDHGGSLDGAQGGHGQGWLQLRDATAGGARPRYAPGWDIMGCLWRRKLLIGVVAALSMLCFATALQLVPKTFRATSMVIFQGDRPSAAREDDAQREPPFGPDTLANEVELLLSEELLTTVATTLQLPSDPEFASKPSQAITAARAVLAWLGVSERLWPRLAEPPNALVETVGKLRSRLTIGPVGVSRVIRITAQSSNPDTAARISNGVAATYIEALLNAKAALTGDAHRWIEQRIDELRARASRSALAYEELRHGSGIVRGKDSTISQEQITQVIGELAQARQLRATTAAMLAATTGTGEAELDRLMAAPGSQLLARLREQLSQVTARQAELEARGGSQLPSVVAIRSQVADITRSIARERERIKQTLRTQLNVATVNEQRLGATLTNLRLRVEQSESSIALMQALERDANADADTYRSFIARARRTDPELVLQSANARVLSRATVPLRPASPNQQLLLPVAAVLSLGLGVVAAIAKESFRSGIQSLSDLPRPGGRAPLGMLPHVRRRDRKLARLWEEAVAQILARVLLPVRGVVPASVLVTSALPKEGKTRTAIALATAAKQRGMRVLLIDADLRCRGVSVEAGLSHSDHSLVRLLRGEITVEQASVFHDAWGFSVLPAGVSHESPMRLLATDEWEGALRDLEYLFDLVIIDTPPVLAAGDTWLLARYADVTMMVARWRSTPVSAVELALEHLTTAEARIAGVALTMVDHREHGQFGFDDSIMFSPKLIRYHQVRRSLS